MTRELTVLDSFEKGTLVQAAPHSAYTGQGATHVYYVPEKARMDAGKQQVHEMESSEPFFDEKTGPDFEAIRELVSVEDIVERAEVQTLNPTDGAIGDSKRPRWRISRNYNSTTDRQSIPEGVVKFGDPDIDSEDTPRRDPHKRGYCWAVLHNRLLSDVECHLKYYDDVQRAFTSQARIPVFVSQAGDESLVAYLTAHDHSPGLIARVLDQDREVIDEIVEELVNLG